jgi:homoserine kinase
MTSSWIAELDGRRVVVDVPATTANLGAGYDCLGMALDLVNRVELEVRGWSRDGVELEVDGEGVGELVADRSNRFVRGLESTLAAARGVDSLGTAWRVTMHNRIPLARGLGSSAAATVAGVVAGNALAGGALEPRDLLRLAYEIEGHLDNAAPALLGGFVAAVETGDGIQTIRVDVPRGLRAVLFIPELRLATDEMRRVLPARVPRADVVANLGRVAVGAAGLALGRLDVLRWLTEDRLHEPYRAAVYPQLPRLVADARAAGAIGACLSGAGSTVVAFSDSLATIAAIEGAFRAAAADTDLPGRVEVAAPRNAGAAVVSSS